MAVTVLVRRATVSDARDACTLVRTSIAELCLADHRRDEATLTQWLANKTEANFERWITSQRHIAFVAEADTALAGFALMNDEGEVLLLYVSPNHRFRGVSTALLRRIEREAVASGIRRLTLDSTITANRFYSARGFVAAGEPHKGFGVSSCAPMAKQIAA